MDIKLTPKDFLLFHKPQTEKGKKWAKGGTIIGSIVAATEIASCDCFKKTKTVTKKQAALELLISAAIGALTVLANANGGSILGDVFSKEKTTANDEQVAALKDIMG